MKTYLAIVLGLVVICSGLQYKKLNGPMSEAQHLPSPADAALHSNHALIPLEYNKVSKFLVDSPAQLILSVLARDAVSVVIQTPVGDRVNLAEYARGQSAMVEESDMFGFGESKFPAKSYMFDKASPGTWSIEVSPLDMPSTTGAFLLVGNVDGPKVSSALSSYDHLVVGGSVEVVTWAEDTGVISAATMDVTDETGRHVVTLDAVNSNGKDFSASFVASQAGTYRVKVAVDGSANGVPFYRTIHRTVAIVAPSVSKIIGAEGSNIDSRRSSIALKIERGPGSNPTVRAYAEVWGTGPDGSVIPVAWIAGMADLTDRFGSTFLDLELDLDWMAKAGAHEPIYLRNALVQDRFTFAPLCTSKELEVKVKGSAFAPASTLARSVKTVTDEMRMGRLPSRGNTSALARGIVLSHGYCSQSNPWVGRGSDFTGDYQKFLDPSANRPTDTFARLIAQAYDGSHRSFGLVGHSQGGMAASHLFTYYNSGLDYASGGAPIQSVGTPYMGCPLSGLLAVIGDLFGVGCGSNDDLTYDGARLWLAGIPSATRTRVVYATTQYSTSPVVRYCSLAANAVLSWPNDGVTEVANGQMSGASNRGNFFGWCHTDGMRYSHQCTDAALNVFFNTNAAR